MKKLPLLVVALAIQAGIASNAEAQQPYCREYTQTVRIGNTLQKGYGTACMQADGSWQMVTPPTTQQMVYATPQPVVVQPSTTYIVQESPVIYAAPRPRPVISFVYGQGFGGGYHHPHYWSRW